MQTGREVLYRAIQLLGYTNEFGEVDGYREAARMKRGRAMVAQILADLQPIERPEEPAKPMPDMDTPLPLSPVAIDSIMPFGVAMLLAQGEGDGENQALYAALYNRRRTTAARSGMRADRLPRPLL